VDSSPRRANQNNTNIGGALQVPAKTTRGRACFERKRLSKGKNLASGAKIQCHDSVPRRATSDCKKVLKSEEGLRKKPGPAQEKSQDAVGSMGKHDEREKGKKNRQRQVERRGGAIKH